MTPLSLVTDEPPPRVANERPLSRCRTAEVASRNHEIHRSATAEMKTSSSCLATASETQRTRC